MQRKCIWVKNTSHYTLSNITAYMIWHLYNTTLDSESLMPLNETKQSGLTYMSYAVTWDRMYYEIGTSIVVIK